MKSDKQRILEAYSEDLKAMTETQEAKVSNVKKWIVEKPKYIAEQHNIVDAYALLAEDDIYRQNKMRMLNEQILLKGKISKVKEIMDFSEKEMERYTEGSQFENSGRFVEARDKFDEAKVIYGELVEAYDDDEEEIDEGEGLKSAPVPSKHSATNSVDGGDSSEGDAETSEVDDELDKVTEAKASKMKFKADMDKAKMDMDDVEDDDSEEMNEVIMKYKEAKRNYKEACDADDMEDAEEMDEGEGEKPAPAPSKHDATDSEDGGLVTKQELGEADDDDDDEDDDKKEMNDIKENKEAYMKYAKGIIGDKDLSKMSDEDTKALFNQIDKGWNSKDEEGADGAK